MCFLRMGTSIGITSMLDQACLLHLERHVVLPFQLQLGLSLMESAQWHFLLHGHPPKLNFVKENLIIGKLFNLLFTKYFQLSLHRTLRIVYFYGHVWATDKVLVRSILVQSSSNQWIWLSCYLSLWYRQPFLKKLFFIYETLLSFFLVYFLCVVQSS